MGLPPSKLAFIEYDLARMKENETRPNMPIDAPEGGGKFHESVTNLQMTTRHVHIKVCIRVQVWFLNNVTLG